MRTLLVALFALLLPFSAAFAASTPDDAQKAGETWLALIDTQKYADSWTQASAVFRERVTQDRWSTAAKNVRESFGPLVKRKFDKVTFSHALEGLPDGQYAVVQFHTTYKNKEDALETLALIEGDGVLRVAGYFIK